MALSSNNQSDWRGIKPLKAEAALSPTLPGYFYHQQSVFEEEKERIFYRHWQLVAHVSQLREPGDFVTLRIIDQSVFVIRGEDSIIRGFYNVCQHRAHELLEGQGCVKSRIVCPYHNWNYNINGDLKSVYRCKQPQFDMSEHGLVEVRVEQMLGFLFVNLDPEAPTLGEISGDMFDDIKVNVPDWESMVAVPQLDSRKFPRAALHTNWKVLSENSLENYHVQTIHPAYAKMVDIDSYQWQMKGLWIKGWGKIQSLDSEAYNIEESEASHLAITWRLWPNTAFFLLPGESSFSVVRYHPESPDLTLRSNITLVRPGQTINEDRWSYLWGTIWEEDAKICESVHRGLRSKGYRQGRFMINAEEPSISEYGPHLFQRNYAKTMGILED